MALLFMIAELSYINSKSLLHLAGSGATIHQAFAIVGAIAFSIVTIIIMQQPGIRWQKVVFPVFDSALVFLGFNLDLYPNMRIYLTIFMAVFAGCIMYSLGKIEHQTGETKEARELAHEKERANSLGKQLDSVKSELHHTSNQLHNTECNLEKVSCDFDNLKSEFTNAKTQIEVMEPIYLKSEIGRIRKKSINNRTPEEIKILESV
ncbi:hypothetical protein [Plebeiibacterium sediminum]|uniref:Uncharacterized protein n=1 Tax=Plebeiibacterium sediminum TaxID=2992112 RepID=A0AAE3M134_9BACT|nr:hypothetical protein [Plebeiobacterium sediminum]MCW3784911.1 hypothetical protein [Plebeiobacterium sediminum]